MLDIQKIRNNPEEVRAALQKRLYEVDFTELLSWDQKRRSLIVESEELKAKKNKVSSEIPMLKKQGKDVTQYKGESPYVNEYIDKVQKLYGKETKEDKND